MADLDVLAPNYARARDRWPDATALSRGYTALVTCFGCNGHGLVEHVKSYIESVCVTILVEFRKPLLAANSTTTALLVAALHPLGMQNTRSGSNLDKMLSGLNKMSEALNDMRNENGPVAHGRDAYLDYIVADHARAFLHAGDAILSVLLNALEGKEPELTVTREPYERFPHLNERIDRAVAVTARIDVDGIRPIVVFSVGAGLMGEVIELRVEPSRLLYGIDRAAYIEVLKGAATISVPLDDEDDEDVESDSANADFPVEIGDASVVVVLPLPGEVRAEIQVPLVIPRYAGRLAPLRLPLEAFLTKEGWRPPEEIARDPGLSDSLLTVVDQDLGLDWRQREALQARLKVTCKRALVQFGFDAKQADATAGRFVQWALVQLPDADTTAQEVA